MKHNTLATDFRQQGLWGHPVLTWWQGHWTGGVGIILNQRYQQIAVVRAGNGLSMDAHEFLVTPQGQAWIVAVSPLRWPGSPKPVLDCVIQEIDIRTRLVMFEWHAIDHIPFSRSLFPPARLRAALDPYHLNSIALDGSGSLIVSMRNTSAVYKIDTHTGAMLWTLGGTRSSFTMGPGTQTAFQHDVSIEPDGTLTLFDNGAGPPAVHEQSRAIRIALDMQTMTARLVSQYVHTPPLLSALEGSAQLLPSHELFVSWGLQAYLTEFNAAGAVDFDAHDRDRGHQGKRMPASTRPVSQHSAPQRAA